MAKVAFLVFVLFHSLAFGQITSSEIKGQINDKLSSPIPGALVQVTHVPTGTVSKLRTDETGSYFLANLKPGGPYTVTVKMPTFKDYLEENIYLSLGEVKLLDVVLADDLNELGEVVVVIDKNDPFSDRRKGAETNINEDQISKLPTINRSLQDMTRVSPQASGNSYVGSNYRYNNLSIDGVANNDAFGFQEPSVGSGGSTAAGSPGALSNTQPISLDAVSEIQIATSPYDVKLGNFTGGSLNVVTRSGMNKTEGSIYNFFKSNATTGRAPYATREKIESFYEVQSGFRIGGAIKKNKFFYFVNAEIGRRSEPSLFAPGNEGSVFALADIQGLYDTLQSRYGYDAGTIGEMALKTNSNKAFLRFDYNINERNQLIVRHNFVQASRENLSRSGTVFNFGSQGFTHNSTTNSTVVELKSRISDKLFNNLIFGFSRIHDFRESNGELFPHIEIKYQGADIFVGAYREASLFQMFQSTYELSDNLTLYKNKHKFTFGTHNELYLFDYHFVTPFTGRYEYNSIQDFYDNKVKRLRGTYNLENDDYEFNYNRPSADFNVLLSAFYFQDDFEVNRKLKLTYGLRAEGNSFLNGQGQPDDIRSDEALGQYAEKISAKYILSPRVGFNWDVLGTNRWKIRGGSGIFAGRMPFAWAAYSYIYNGAQYGSVDIRPTGTTELITSDFGQMAALQPGKREINLVDPDFKLPRVLRSSLATDVKLPKDFVLTIEGIYTKTIYDIYFKTINIKDSTVELLNSGNDNREIYLGNEDEQRVNSDYSNVFLLTNTNKGYRSSLAVSLSKKFDEHFSAFAAYTYGVSKDIMNGVRVSPQANWEWNQTIAANDPQLSFSNFDIRHKIVSNLTYDFKWNEQFNTEVSFFVIASSGSPFSYVYNGDLNRDYSSRNDLVYVPNNSNEINLVPFTNNEGVLVTAEEQWTQLDAYIANDEYLSGRRGQYTERNGGRTPWNAQLDMHFGQEYSLKGKKRSHKLALTLDVFNITNLLNYKWGRQYFVPNTTNSGYSLINVKKVNSDGTAEFTFDSPSTPQWQIDTISSRLQMQVGLRYSF